MLKGEVKVLIEAPALVAVLERLVGVMEKGQASDSVLGVEKEVAQVAPQEPPKKRTKPKKEVPAEEEAQEEQKAEDTEEFVHVAPSVAEIRDCAKEKGKTAEGKAAIKSLLETYNSKSISTLPEESRAAFMADLETI